MERTTNQQKLEKRGRGRVGDRPKGERQLHSMWTMVDIMNDSYLCHKEAAVIHKNNGYLCSTKVVVVRRRNNSQLEWW